MFCLLAAEGEKFGGAARPLAAEELLHLICGRLGSDQEVFQVVSLELA